MSHARSTLAGCAVLLSLAAPVAAQDAGTFVVRLGSDTTAIETFSRTARRITIDQFGRAPRVLDRKFVFDYDARGRIRRASSLVTAPGAAPKTPPVQNVIASFDADSVRLEIRRDTTVTRSSVAVPANAIVAINTSPWVVYEKQTMKLAREKGDSLRTPLWLLGSTTMSWLYVARRGADSMVVQTQNDTYQARVDAQGRILGVRPITGTQRISVDRVTKIDRAGIRASWLAREKSAGAMGALSPRDTVHANIEGASLWVDYSRPSKRGRVIFGTVVPYGELWRTGANAATQFRTDKALEMGGVEVAAGTYTLWTIPSPGAWTLILNSEVGISGTERKAEKDVYRMNMTLSANPDPVERFTISFVPQGKGGALNLEWDTTRASVPFTVKD